jgi:predicted Zn finger-like uncharacterized protein
MPITIACPNCDARFQAPDTFEGKRVKCKKCGETFVARPADVDEDDRPARPAAKAAARARPRPVDDDEDDSPSRRFAKASRREEDDSDEDRPRRRRRDDVDAEDEPRPRKKKGKKKKATGSPVLLIVLIAVGAVVLIGGGIGVYYGFIKEDKPADQPVAKGDASNGPVGKAGAVAGADAAWYEHVDVDGKYRIKFPRQPAPEIRTINEGGMQVTVKAMMAQTNQEVLVSSVVALPDPNADPEVILQSAAEQAASRVRGGATVTDKKEVTHGGVQGREIRLNIQGGRLNGVVRVFVTNGRVYTIGAVGPGYQASTPNVAKFFESLKFE